MKIKRHKIGRYKEYEVVEVSFIHWVLNKIKGVFR